MLRSFAGPFQKALVVEHPDPVLDELLAADGLLVDRAAEVPDEQGLIRMLNAGGHQVLFKRSRVPVTRAVIEACPSLHAVQLCCIGDDSVDKRACADPPCRGFDWTARGGTNREATPGRTACRRSPPTGRSTPALAEAPTAYAAAPSPPAPPPPGGYVGDVARLDQRYPDNAPGDVYVDRSCIDCGTCRHVAPRTFAEADDHSFVAAQPASPEERLRALMALVACPTHSIGTVDPAPMKQAVAAFPEEVLPGVYYCGFASPDSYGAAAWLVVRPEGNVLVDSPRAAAPLLARVEALGGVRYVFLTHRDDVADHAVWAKRFGAARVIHRGDLGAVPDAEIVVDGDGELAPDLRVIALPGHTRGSMGLLYREDVLFSGDHLWGRNDALGAGRGVCWYDWAAQIRSMERLRGVPFGHVLPGHGAPWHGGAAAKDAALDALIARMRRAA